ncbi:MAG: tRNA 2-thiocytidine(32) synthetase TtcA [Deltaproteobacteria bacterium]|nr:tRNA 2-thiocytidine(32) synthetase TtcA [Deltaproteobacteria bacterium]
MAASGEQSALERRLLKTVARTSIAYRVLEPDDRIAVAVSGGKDSYGLLHLLDRLRRRLPFSIELIAVHVAQGQPGYDGTPLRDWLRQSGIRYRIVEEDTYSIVRQRIDGGATPCALCSRLRRGILYTTARRLGCNKVALGHHRDDALGTLLLNLFYAGTLQAMPARYLSDDGDCLVIRPLIEAAESDLERLAELLRFPIVPCSFCGSRPDARRAAMGRLLAELERDHPQLRSVMLGALKNVRPSHLLDVELNERLAP